MATKDFRGREIIVKIGDAGNDEIARKKRGAIIGPAPRFTGPFTRRILTSACAWIRRWNFTYQSYRVWTIPGGTIYNGTRFFNRATNNISSSIESCGVAQGNSGVITDIIEPFDANAVPMTGTVSFTFDKEAGTGTLTTPFGSYPVSPPLILVSSLGLRWFATYQFRNYFLQVLLRQETGLTATLSYQAEPFWVSGYSGFFRITRNDETVTLEGINVVQENGQGFDYVTGDYELPIPSPCDEETADEQGEAARAAFEAEFDSYAHIRNPVFGPVQYN